MSWRFLTLILLLAAGAAAVGGMQLGDWLVAHAPVAAPPPNADGTEPGLTVLDAEGKPYLAQPPQPLVSGALGVPEAPQGAEWNITGQSLLVSNTNPHVHVSGSRMSPAEVRDLAQATAKLPAGPADVVTADVLAPGQGSSPAAQVDAPPMPSQSMTPFTAPGSGGNWQASLRAELAQCAKLGFFERPSCAWGARNRYCEPNRAWGSIPECPRRPD